MKMQDTIKISEFNRNTKMFLDAANKGPVYLRRGFEIFKLEAVELKTEVAIGEAPAVHTAQDYDPLNPWASAPLITEPTLVPDGQ